MARAFILMDAAQRGKRDGVFPPSHQPGGGTWQSGRNLTTAPIIVSALLGDADFAWADGLRRAHFPPERNVLRAHLTLFHHLPPSSEGELLGRLRAATDDVPPPAMIDGLMSLGYGVAYRVRSDALCQIRADIAEAFAAMLIPQDQAAWRPHITVQNKAKPVAAKALLAALSAEFKPRPLVIAGLAAWHYRGGPWSPIAAYRFGGGRAMKTPPPLIAS